MYDQRIFPETHLISIRDPFKNENTNADKVFIREDENGNIYKIYVLLPDGYYSWQQWGQCEEILGDNVEDLEMYIEDMLMLNI